jgi:hypothetical protein
MADSMTGLLTKIPIINYDITDGQNLKLLLDLAMVPTAALLFGLFVQAATRTSAMWYVCNFAISLCAAKLTGLSVLSRYVILEKMIGISFVGVAASLVFFLPFTWEAVRAHSIFALCPFGRWPGDRVLGGTPGVSPPILCVSCGKNNLVQSFPASSQCQISASAPFSFRSVDLFSGVFLSCLRSLINIPACPTHHIYCHCLR